MSIREQFEAAVIERFKASGYLPVEIRTELLQRSGDDYHDGSVSAYWHFWQASRQALMVELPPSIPMPDEENDSIEDFEMEEAIAFTGNGMRAACRSAIEAAGVRVKT